MREQSLEERVVVVGGGPAARYLLDSLVGALERAPRVRLAEVVVVEQGGCFATGLPYTPDLVLPEHTLAFNQNISRAEMGRKLQTLFHEHCARLHELGAQARLLANTSALDIVPGGPLGLSVQLADGTALSASRVVLATGHWHGASPWEGAPGFISSPWPASALQAAVPADARVAILGSGLTGVDAVKTIALAHGRFERRGGELRYVPRRQSRQLRLSLYSRNGWLPKVCGTGLSWAEPEAGAGERYNRFLTVERVEAVRRRQHGVLRLENLYRLLVRELHHAGAAEELCAELPELTGRNLRRDLQSIGLRWQRIGGGELFRRDFERARQSIASGRYVPWQSVLWEKIELLNFYYSFLDGEERRLYCDHETLLMRFLQQVHFDSAESLLALFRAGCLELAAVGDDYTLEPLGGGEGWALRFAGRQDERRLVHHSLLIDARGQPKDVEANGSALYRNLLRRGLIQPAVVPFLREPAPAAAASADGRLVRLDGRLFFRPGGIHLNPDTFEVVPRGEVSQSWRGEGRLFVLGPPAAGHFLAFLGLRALWYQAHLVAGGIVERAGDRASSSARAAPPPATRRRRSGGGESQRSQPRTTAELTRAGDGLRLL